MGSSGCPKLLHQCMPKYQRYPPGRGCATHEQVTPPSLLLTRSIHPSKQARCWTGPGVVNPRCPFSCLVSFSPLLVQQHLGLSPRHPTTDHRPPGASLGSCLEELARSPCFHLSTSLCLATPSAPSAFATYYLPTLQKTRASSNRPTDSADDRPRSLHLLLIAELSTITTRSWQKGRRHSFFCWSYLKRHL